MIVQRRKQRGRAVGTAGAKGFSAGESRRLQIESPSAGKVHRGFDTKNFERNKSDLRRSMGIVTSNAAKCLSAF